MEELSNLQKSFELVKKHKIIFIPNLLIMISNSILVLLLYLILYLSGINIYNETQEISIILILSLFTILILMALIDNFFTCSKYGMIKDIVKKNKTSLISGFKFGKKFYFTSLKIHLIVYTLLLLPLFIIALLITELSYGWLLKIIFLTLLTFYLIYVSLRLLFIFPIMAFEEKGAYYSFREGFHYIKLHLQHNIMTWIFAIGIALSFSLVKQMIKEELLSFAGIYIVLSLLGLTILALIEIGVSLWEHMFIFQAYLTGKKDNITKRKKSTSNKKNRVKQKKEVITKKTYTKKKDVKKKR
ncbi:hypothetical protein HN385_06430 [archaeon]|jgi:membrane-anchored glycerophosphoryl diester phosphodiesterase (GDPDase)|nr:hypothetical protein [archaeon]MBT3450756.1 hypothetical protein [archaeon]MBT6869519.1 hypothetical protein [archaeon]MBT7193684.1 hypothetical protein [archaeon]MBT7380375.1 hypothetical protein [archaeon]